MVRWEGQHLEQYSTIARDQFYSDLRDTFIFNQSIRLAEGYFISKDLNRRDDLQYLDQLAERETFPPHVVGYIKDRLSSVTMTNDGEEPVGQSEDDGIKENEVPQEVDYLTEEEGEYDSSTDEDYEGSMQECY